MSKLSNAMVFGALLGVSLSGVAFGDPDRPLPIPPNRPESPGDTAHRPPHPNPPNRPISPGDPAGDRRPPHPIDPGVTP